MGLIIYAEDDKLMASVVRNMLTGEGHLVGLVADGRAALKAIRVKRPDLVILDCSMPEIAGIEVLRQIRLDRALYDMPVLMLTARRSEKDFDLAAYAGADGYVKKPFDPDYLLYVAESLLAEGRAAGHMAH